MPLNSKNNAVWPPISTDLHVGGMNLLYFRMNVQTGARHDKQTVTSQSFIN